MGILITVLVQAAQDHGVDGTCWKLLGIASTIVAALAAAVVVLWNAYKNSQEGRLADEVRHRDTLRELYEIIARRRK